MSWPGRKTKRSPVSSTARVHNKPAGADAPDLQTQLESVLDQVWRCEADWRVYDRIDAFCASEPDHCMGSSNR